MNDIKIRQKISLLQSGIILLAITGLLIPFLFNQNNLVLLGSYMAIPMIFSVLIYNKFKNYIDHIMIFKSNYLYLLISFLSVYVVSLYLILFYEVRQYIYYISISLLSIIILLEILFYGLQHKNNVYIILSQVILLILNIIYGVNLKYYFFLGRVDVFFHSNLIENLIKNGFVTDVFGMYKSFPLWHILNSMFYNILNLSIEKYKIMFLLSGFIYSFLIIITYLISYKLLNDKRLSLISALFMSINPDTIFTGTYSISRSIDSVLGIFLLYLLLQPKNKINILLSIFMTYIVTAYHTVSIIFIFPIFLLIELINRIYYKSSKPFLQKKYIITTIIIIFVYWVNFSERLFSILIDNVLIISPREIITKSITLTPLNEWFNYLQYSPLIFLMLIGLFFTLGKNSSKFLKSFVIVGTLSIIVSFPGPAQLLNKIARDFKIIRYAEYTFIMISIISAVGFYKIFSKFGNKGKVIMIILISVTSFLSVSNDFTSSDNPIIKRPFFTYYLSKQEVIASKYISIESNNLIITDKIMNDYFISKNFTNTNIIEINNDKTEILKNSIEDIILLRRGELNKRPLQVYYSQGNKFIRNPTLLWDLSYIYGDLKVWRDLYNTNLCYNSGSTYVFK